VNVLAQRMLAGDLIFAEIDGLPSLSIAITPAET
jgi:hypothetical protein